MRALRVLIAEDQDSARRALASLLSDEGYQVAEAATGEEAMSLLASFVPDVVLGDVQMPRLNGLALLQATMAHPHQPAFVLMSSCLPAPIQARATAMGCAAVLTKPLDIESALTTVRLAAEHCLEGPTAEVTSRASASSPARR